MANERSENIEVVKPHRKANIAVIIVVSIAAAILITIAVLSLVRVDPVSGLAEPEFYNFYNAEQDNPEFAVDNRYQSRIRTALAGMKFSAMSAVLQWNWDYTYNFKRNSSDEKIELAAAEIKSLRAEAGEYMIEYVFPQIKFKDGELDYSNAQSLKVDGETIYFDRIKMIISDTEGTVGILSFYPYISARLDNQSDIDGVSSESYTVTGINVRANTTTAYAALKELAADLA